MNLDQLAVRMQLPGEDAPKSKRDAACISSEFIRKARTYQTLR